VSIEGLSSRKSPHYNANNTIVGLKLPKNKYNL